MKVQGFNIIKTNNWNGLRTIKDIWIELYKKGIITYKEKVKMPQLSHVEQQKELEKYKGLYEDQ